MMEKWIVIENAMPDDWCAMVLEDSARMEAVPLEQKGKIRLTCKTFNHTSNPEIANGINAVAREANRRHFGFHIDGAASVELFRFDKGDFLWPHVDLQYAEHGAYERKLTVIIALGFHGGLVNVDGEELKLDDGSVLVLPSFVPYSVPEVDGRFDLLVGFIEGVAWR